MNSQAPTETMVFEYELHHPGLLRSFVSQIGSETGINALYWKDGVCIYEKTTRSRALIEQETRDGWRGVIRLQTQGGQATALLAQLAERLMNEQSHWGILSHESPGAPQLHRLELDASKAASAESTPPETGIHPGTGVATGVLCFLCLGRLDRRRQGARGHR